MYTSFNTAYNIPEIDQSSVNLTGQCEKGLLVVCSKESYTAEDEIILKKLVSAIKYDFEKDIYLLILNQNQLFPLNKLDISYTDLLVFGINIENLGFNIDSKTYEILSFDQCRVLISESIQELNRTTSKKAMLWAKLQQMFLL